MIHTIKVGDKYVALDNDKKETKINPLVLFFFGIVTGYLIHCLVIMH